MSGFETESFRFKISSFAEWVLLSESLRDLKIPIFIWSRNPQVHLKDIAIMHFSNIWIITRIRNWSGISSPEYFSLSLDYTQKWFLNLILTLRWKTEFNWPENIWSTFILSSKLISFLHKNPKQFHYHLVNKNIFFFSGCLRLTVRDVGDIGLQSAKPGHLLQRKSRHYQPIRTMMTSQF